MEEGYLSVSIEALETFEDELGIAGRDFIGGGHGWRVSSCLNRRAWLSLCCCVMYRIA